MIVSVVIGLLGTPLLGVLCDRISPTITIPAAFTSRCVTMILFLFIRDPAGFYAYLVAVLLVLTTSFEQISNDAMIMRNAEREIRGTIYGTSMAFGYVGQFTFCLVGGFLFDYVSPYAPFFFVGLVDLGFAITALVLAHRGILTDDISERKLREHKAKEALKLMKEQNSGEQERLIQND